MRATLPVAQLVEALRYKPEGSGFNSRWGHRDWRNHSGRTMVLGSTQPLIEMTISDIYPGGGEDKGGRCRGLTMLMCRSLEILGASTSWSPGDLSRPNRDSFVCGGPRSHSVYVNLKCVEMSSHPCILFTHCDDISAFHCICTALLLPYPHRTGSFAYLPLVLWLLVQWE
jgi:hypothetical protein